MDNPEKLATYGTHDEKKTKTKTQHNMCWTPLYANKHIYRKQDITPSTNNCRQRRTELHPHAEIVADITTRTSERKEP